MNAQAPPPVPPLEGFDPMAVANGLMEEFFPLIAATEMDEENQQLTANVVFEFAKIAGQLLVQEPFFQPPDSPQAIPFSADMCRMTVQYFCDGLIHAAEYGYKEGLPLEVMSQILQTLAQDLFFQTKQMLASTAVMEGLPPELQQPLNPDQMLAIVHQTAVNGFQFYIGQYEQQVGPIERVDRSATAAPAPPTAQPDQAPAPLAMADEPPPVPEPTPPPQPEPPPAAELADPLPNPLEEDPPPPLEDLQTASLFPEDAFPPAQPEDARDGVLDGLPLDELEEDPESAITAEDLFHQDEPPTNQSPPPAADVSPAQSAQAPPPAAAVPPAPPAQAVPTAASPTAESVDLTQVPVTSELLAALALYLHATRDGVTLRALMAHLKPEEWHQVASFQTLGDVLLKPESGLHLRQVRDYLQLLQRQVADVRHAQRLGNVTEHTRRLENLQERQAGIRWAAQVKKLFQQRSLNATQMVPLIREERERVQQLVAEALYAVSVDTPVQWRDLPSQCREALLDYLEMVVSHDRPSPR